MMMKHMLPKELSLESDSEPLKTRFNSLLGGKLLVAFEELSSNSTGEWMAMSNALKRLITSTTITLESKGQNRFDADNINNYCLLSNHDLQDDGRRFFVLEISTHRKGDMSDANKKFWKKLYDTCFNDDVGYALYCYFCELDTKGFNAQNFPETSSKLSSISKRLDSVYRFLKDSFVLKNSGIDLSVGDLHADYISYCASISVKPCGKINFTEKMKEIGFTHVLKKICGKQYNKYIISRKALFSVAKQSKWIHELDEFDDTGYDEFEQEEDKDTYEEQETKICKQQEEIEDLKQQIKKLMKTKKTKTKKIITEQIFEEENYEEEYKERDRDFSKDLLYDFEEENITEKQKKPKKKGKNIIVNKDEDLKPITSKQLLTKQQIKENKRKLQACKEVSIDCKSILDLI